MTAVRPSDMKRIGIPIFLFAVSSTVGFYASWFGHSIATATMSKSCAISKAKLIEQARRALPSTARGNLAILDCTKSGAEIIITDDNDQTIFRATDALK